MKILLDNFCEEVAKVTVKELVNFNNNPYPFRKKVINVYGMAFEYTLFYSSLEQMGDGIFEGSCVDFFLDNNMNNNSVIDSSGDVLSVTDLWYYIFEICDISFSK